MLFPNLLCQFNQNKKMKKLILTAYAAVLLTGMAIAQNNLMASAKTETVHSSSTGAEFNWEKTKFDFGQIPQNKPATLTYSFTNTGKAPLIITNVIPSCGCTGAEFSKEAIAPGKKGLVKITYNAASVGNFTKTLT